MIERLTGLLWRKAFDRIVNAEPAPSEREHIERLERILNRESN